MVILEFSSVAQAQRRYDSEEYREPKAMRNAPQGRAREFRDGRGRRV